MNPSRFASRFRFAHSYLSLGPGLVVVIRLETHHDDRTHRNDGRLTRDVS